VAVVELGLSPQEFWDLTWYDWGLFVLRVIRNQKKFIDDQELYLAVERIKIADFRNAHRGKNEIATRPQDIFQLSFDKALTTDERPLTFKEAKALFGSKMKK
jgi:hypothetical protein